MDYKVESVFFLIRIFSFLFDYIFSFYLRLFEGKNFLFKKLFVELANSDVISFCLKKVDVIFFEVWLIDF